MKHEYIKTIVGELEAQNENSVLIEWVDGILSEMYRIATEEANAKQSERLNELERYISDLEHPTLKMHTKRYKEQCPALQDMSDVEKEAFDAGYNWACKIAQQQILAICNAHEETETKLDKKLETLLEALKKQIETLRGAAKSWVYTEREQNILTSQADDIEKILSLDQPAVGNENGLVAK